MPKGIIKHLTDRGFGFIKTEQGEDLFFHHNELQGVDYNSLRVGQRVEFEIGRRHDGRSQAVRVRITEYQAQPDEPKEVAIEEEPVAEAVPKEVAAEGESIAEADTDNL